MANVASQASQHLVEILAAPEGLQESIAAVSIAEECALPEIQSKYILSHNIAFDATEKALELRYPCVHVYCERIVNLLREKFRRFSGKIEMAIEVRVSHDRLDGIERKAQQYVDATTQVLDRNRGDWGDGLFYTGGYEVAFSPVTHGGKNFIQTAKVTLEVQASQG